MRTRIVRWIGVLAVCAIAAASTLAYAFTNGNGVPEDSPSTWFEFTLPAVTSETCDGFNSRGQAQRFFDQHRRADYVRRLDPDNDGEVCENFSFWAR